MSNPEIKKSYEEINSKLKKGKAVIVTADEMPNIVSEHGVKEAFKKVDIVTTGTFGTMCSSGAFFNFGHTKPKIKASKAFLNNVEAYGGIGAVDCFIGATQVANDDPLNKVHPGKFKYGGGHVIEDLIAGKTIKLEAESYGTDCYPLKEFKKEITIDDLRNAFLYNPRNAYQNYNVAINLSNKTKYTYMGILRPNGGNITYSSAGQLSPLLNDPFYWTIGSGTKIFLGGTTGVVTWQGTQHAPESSRTENGIVNEGAGTIAVTGDMKEMNKEFIRGVSLAGYGTSLMVGLGIPIPILNEELAFFTGQSDADIKAKIFDFGNDYPAGISNPLAEVSYAELKSGQINFNGREIKTSPLSSYPGAVKIANILKQQLTEGVFTLGVPQLKLPSTDFPVKF
jgi:uncharacterized protein (DUF39 family)